MPDGVARDLPGVEWDARTSSHRAPAWRAAELVTALGLARPPWPDERVAVRRPDLRDYQRDALAAWELAGRRGVIVLPTGAGKTRTAIAAIAATARPAAVLCPTRALVEQWIVALRGAYGGLVGCVSDGSASVGPITVLTFESAFRRMDSIGDRFALLVVDEVHHFGSGARAEALSLFEAALLGKLQRSRRVSRQDDVVRQKASAIRVRIASTEPPCFTADDDDPADAACVTTTLQRSRRVSRRMTPNDLRERGERCPASTEPPCFTADDQGDDERGPSGEGRFNGAAVFHGG